MYFRRLAIAAIVFQLPWHLAHADWPHIRGPNYDGHCNETGIVENWPAEGPPRLWIRELGEGYSGFFVGNGRVFTQRQSLDGQYVLCLDLDTGKTIWETRYEGPWQPSGAYPGPYATPTFYNGRIYYSSPNGIVGCLDAQTGTNIWSLNVRQQFQGRGYGFGYAITPLVEDGRVILPVGGPSASLVALNADDGNVLWISGSDPSSYSSALPIMLQGKRFIVASMQNAFAIVEPATGRQVHHQSTSSGYDEHSAWPLYREPFLVLLSPFRMPAICLDLQLQSSGEIKCRQNWSNKEFSNDILSSVIHDGHIYGFDIQQNQASSRRTSRGKFRCVDFSTGKTKWTTDRIGHTSLLIADGKLILLNDTGNLILARANPTEYQELARCQLFKDEMCWTQPTLWHGRLFIRSPSHAICLFLSNPAELPTIGDAQLPAGPVGRRKMLDSNWLMMREREFPNDAPTAEEMWTWFAACIVICLGGGQAIALLVIFAISKMSGVQLNVRPIFVGAAVLLSLLGPVLFSSVTDRVLFTWPAMAFAAFHGTVAACWQAEKSPRGSRSRWISRFAVAFLLIVCFAYFELCKSIGFFLGWVFLIGFLPAFPFSVLAVRSSILRSNKITSGVWTLVSFAAYYWAAQAILLLKEHCTILSANCPNLLLTSPSLPP